MNTMILRSAEEAATCEHFGLGIFVADGVPGCHICCKNPSILDVVRPEWSSSPKTVNTSLDYCRCCKRWKGEIEFPTTTGPLRVKA